jgi:hypothetical protein
MELNICHLRAVRDGETSIETGFPRIVQFLCNLLVAFSAVHSLMSVPLS